ncbi:MAG: alpha/beta hydrolase [Ilumatobacteraceae bacterium]|nr:alpha/beta hydrolase [Ilumatobacteraceae bacterium]
MTSTPTFATSATTRFLSTPEGRIGYEVEGHGPLVVLVPGMGDLRSAYRFLAPVLVAAGFRVATTDLRGHGDSDTTFPSYGDDETASDVIALIDELGGPAVVIGNSMSAGSAVIVAAHRAELVAGLVLIGPFVRNGAVSVLQRIMLRAAMTPLWAAAAWKSYMPKLYAGQRPADFEEHRDRIVTSLRRRGYAKAFSLTTRTNHDPAEACLSKVSSPTLVVMGEDDPDFADPMAEAAWLAGALGGQILMVADAGHYPQSQQPEVVTPAVVSFSKTVTARA